MSQFDNLRDKATDYAKDNPDKVEQASDQAGDKVNDATGNKYDDQVQKGQDALQDQLGGDQQGQGQQGQGQQGQGDGGQN